MSRVAVSMPTTAKRGEVVEIKALAAHAMENGFRRTQTGELIPRDIITRFVCTYNGAEVFSCELHAAMAANPLIGFSTVATETGTLEFRWLGDNGYTASYSAALTVL